MGKYDLLKEYVTENENALTMTTDGTSGGNGIIVVPTMKAIDPIVSHPKISDEVKDELVDIMSRDPALVQLIVNELNRGVQIVTNCVSTHRLRLKRPWDMYKLSMVHVAQATYPNTLDRYLRMYGYSGSVEIPWNFKTGLLIHMDLCTFDVMKRLTSTLSIGVVWFCYEDKDHEIQVKKEVVVLAP